MHVRTRFAPSPTGYLHIGGLRTALFAFLFARHHGGRFILRIEDTDRDRLVEGAQEDIIESLKWVGLSWDEGPEVGGTHAPYLQSQRLEIYKSHAFGLVENGHAYRCFCSSQRLQEKREARKKQGRAIIYDGHCRNLPLKEVQRHLQNNDPFVIRLKTPLQGETSFEDSIRGTISTGNNILDDIVLLKSDGFPTYHLANVVDDHLMEITHVIRGDEWISSTPKHILLYRGFGWQPPEFAHVPVILAPGGGKLSKRHGATMVKEFKQKGYLPEALVNFLALLGWSLDDKTEFFSLQELINHFDIGQVNKSSCVFSYDKLEWFNGVYIRKKPSTELYNLIVPQLIHQNILTEQECSRYRDYIMDIIPLIRERMKYLSQAGELMWFFFDKHFEVKEKKYLLPKKLSREKAVEIFSQAKSRLGDTDPFTEKNLEKVLRKLVDDMGCKAGQVFMPLRVALTGTRVSPGLFETMRVLGKNRVLERLEEALEIVKIMQ
ncbi:MAG: glutamate--tRNA ligase [Spirochaetota bacterium]